jgi:hypothetical protein
MIAYVGPQAEGSKESKIFKIMYERKKNRLCFFEKDDGKATNTTDNLKDTDFGCQYHAYFNNNQPRCFLRSYIILNILDSLDPSACGPT